MSSQAQQQQQQPQQQKASTMLTNNDPNLLSYMGVPGTEADAAAMDDYQFMDALLEDGANFEDEPVNVHISMMASGGATSSMQSSMGETMPQHQTMQPSQQSQSSGSVGVGRHYHQPQTEAQCQQPSIMPSPLTARLNFPYPPASSKPKASLPISTAPAITSRRKSKETGLSTFSKKRSRNGDAPPVSEDESEQQRRRMDRNMREQQRSHKITSQIANLKDLLAAGNVPFKPDKYSTLVSVADYIRQLQSRSQMLDAEHKKLVDTIAKTNEMVNSPYYPSDTGSPKESTPNDVLSNPAALALETEQAVFVRDLDYQSVFKKCCIPLSVASIDGRFIACNAEFEALTGYDKDELLSSESDDEPSTSRLSTDSGTSSSGAPFSGNTSRKKNLSLFNLLGRDDMENVFLAMSRMLKQPRVPTQHSVSSCGNGSEPFQPDYWSGDVRQSRLHESKIRINVTLVRTQKGHPKFFQCALTPSVDEASDRGSSEPNHAQAQSV